MHLTDSEIREMEEFVKDEIYFCANTKFMNLSQVETEEYIHTKHSALLGYLGWDRTKLQREIGLAYLAKETSEVMR